MSTIPDYDTLSDINFTGGFPTHRDLAPSIVFIVLYSLTVPVVLWRIIVPRYRTWLLYRIVLFLGCRLAMLIIRVIMATSSSWSLGLLIAELILVGVGYLLLLEPILVLFKRTVDAAHPKHRYAREPLWLLILLGTCWAGLLAAVAMTVAAGVMISDAIDQGTGVQTIINLRHASYITSLIIVGCILFALLICFAAYRTSVKQTLYLLIPICALLVVGVYRVVQTYTTSPSAAARKLSTFWILQITFEFIAYVSYIAISIPGWYPSVHNDVVRKGGVSDPERSPASGHQTLLPDGTDRAHPSGRRFADSYPPATGGGGRFSQMRSGRNNKTEVSG
ncbi:hypothetical protein JCM24511_00410 [Saitozyma sp. JCM 24511]|nr:hypothetical protein JCM24511_00410 [Saitozyma sp. JCM 24511]